jgi:hypothetical protein
MKAHIHFNISTLHLLSVHYFPALNGVDKPPPPQANIVALGKGGGGKITTTKIEVKFEVDSFRLNSILLTKGGVLNTCYEIWE